MQVVSVRCLLRLGSNQHAPATGILKSLSVPVAAAGWLEPKRDKTTDRRSSHVTIYPMVRMFAVGALESLEVARHELLLLAQCKLV